MLTVNEGRKNMPKSCLIQRLISRPTLSSYLSPHCLQCY